MEQNLENAMGTTLIKRFMRILHIITYRTCEGLCEVLYTIILQDSRTITWTILQTAYLAFMFEGCLNICDA